MALPDYKTFEAAIGQTVELEAGGMHIRARIAEVDARRKQNEGGGHDQRQSFSILFISEHDQVIPQQVFTLHHEELGPAELFLVPVGPMDGGMAYEAIFS